MSTPQQPWKVMATTIEEVLDALTQLGYYTEVSRLPVTGKVIRVVASKPRGGSVSGGYESPTKTKYDNPRREGA